MNETRHSCETDTRKSSTDVSWVAKKLSQHKLTCPECLEINSLSCGPLRTRTTSRAEGTLSGRCQDFNGKPCETGAALAGNILPRLERDVNLCWLPESRKLLCSSRRFVGQAPLFRHRGAGPATEHGHQRPPVPLDARRSNVQLFHVAYVFRTTSILLSMHR